ncbi:MAG: tetratricopeptide repeat protein [Deltaproteobacteria bacterium]
MSDQLEDLARTAETSPDDPWPWLDLARALIDGGALHPGRHVLQRAAGVAKGDASVWLEIGRTLERAEAIDGAVDAYRQVCRLAPGVGGGELSLSRVWLRDREPEAAEMEARRGLMHLPNDRALHASLARALYAQERFDEALPHAERAAEGTATEEELRLAADLHRRTGDIARARTLLEQLFAMEPQDAETALALAETALAEGDVARATAALDAAQRVGVVNPPNAVRLAVGFNACGRPDAALAALANLEGEHSTSGLVALQRGIAMEALGRNTDALDAFSRAISSSPPPPRSAFHFGRALARVGRNDEAATHLLSAAADEPNDPEVRAALSEVLGAVSGKQSSVPESNELDVDLKIFSLPELLEFLAQNGSSGVLELTMEEGVAHVTMNAGLLLAVSLPGGLSLAERLGGLGVDKAIAERADDDEPDLDGLRAICQAEEVDVGAVAMAVSRSVVRGLVSLVPLTEGRARFSRAAADAELPSGVGVATQAALFDAIRRLDERKIGRETSASKR